MFLERRNTGKLPNYLFASVVANTSVLLHFTFIFKKNTIKIFPARKDVNIGKWRRSWERQFTLTTIVKRILSLLIIPQVPLILKVK